MWLAEIEFENGYNSLETTSEPVLRSTLPTSYIKRQGRVWSPIGFHQGRQRYRLSTDDTSLFDKVVSNARNSIHGYNIFRQHRNRHFDDDIIEEVD
jgi:hypothetical protein